MSGFAGHRRQADRDRPNAINSSSEAATNPLGLERQDALPPLGDDDAVALVFIEEIQTLDDPQIEPAADVFGDLLNDVTPVLEPLEFRARRYRKDGLFTFFAVISELHRRSIPGRRENAFVA